MDRYGIDREKAERLIEPTSCRPEKRSDYALPPGTSTGLQITYDLKYDISKDSQVIVAHVNPVSRISPTRLPTMADFDNSGIHELMKDVSRRAFLAWAHGKDSLGYYEALRKEGLMEAEHEVAYTALKEQQAFQGSIVTSSLEPGAEGGVEMHLSFDSRAYKEKMVNEAIKSLGDREGDDPQDIAADLTTALRDRDHGLPDDHLIQIAEFLSEGEEVIVGVSSGPAQ